MLQIALSETDELTILQFLYQIMTSRTVQIPRIYTLKTNSEVDGIQSSVA